MTVIDTSSPGTIEDIEHLIPESEHTGNIRRLWAAETPTYDRWTTNAARLPSHAYLSSDYLAGPSNVPIQRTQGEGQEWFYLLSFLNARLLDASVLSRYHEAPRVLMLQLSARTQEQFRLLASAAQWRGLREALWSNVPLPAPVTLPLAEAFVNQIGADSSLHVQRQLTNVGRPGKPWADLVTTGDDLSTILGSNRGLLTSPTGATTVAEVVRGLRDMIDLPVQDIARMCGVGRRQFYNLMNGTSQSSSTQERRLRDLSSKISTLYEELGEQATYVRAAVLTPLADGDGSFYDASLSGDAMRLESAFEQLIGKVRRGETSQRSLAPSGRLSANHPSWTEAAERIGMRGSEGLPFDPPNEK